MPGGYKAENNLPLIAKTFTINTVEVFLSSLLLAYKQTNKQKVGCNLVTRNTSSLKFYSSRKGVTSNPALERGDIPVLVPQACNIYNSHTTLIFSSLLWRERILLSLFFFFVKAQHCRGKEKKKNLLSLEFSTAPPSD